MSDENKKRWTPDEISSLLNAISNPSGGADGEAFEEPAADISAPEIQEEKTVRIGKVSDTIIKSDDTVNSKYIEAETGNVNISSNTAKQRVADVLAGIEKEKTEAQASAAEEKTVRADTSLLPHKEHSMETDEIRRRFFEEAKFDDDDPVDTASTKEVDLYEKPGFMVKRNTHKIWENEAGLEEVPVLVESEDVEDDEDLYVDVPEKKEELTDWSEGQLRIPGFDPEEEPEQVSESDAEKDLKTKRRDRINAFKVKGIGEAEDLEKKTDDDMVQLFGEPEKKKAPLKQRPSKSRLGFEYTNIKDAGRIRATLHRYKLFSSLRMLGCAVIAAILLALNIISQVTAGYDSRLIGFFNIVLLLFVILLGRDSINKGVVLLFKKEADMSSAVTAVMFAALVQSVSVFVLDCILEYHSFMLSGAAAVAFAFFEYGEWLRHSRTYDAFNFCTVKNPENLYSVQRVENKDEEFEIGRKLLMDNPDIRYSCKAKMPSRLIERCEKEVTADKLQILLLPCACAGALICGIIAGIFSKDVMYGFTAAAAAVCVCVPAYGVASIQLPLYWANKRLNQTGGVLTSQAAVDEYSRANSLVINSTDLFDLKGCCLYGLKDYKRVRIDDVMLYAAAMVVHSEGPLAEAFEQVVSNREMLPEVTSFKYEDRMGISGWINGQKVIMGNKNMMKHHNFDVDFEDESKYVHNGRRVVYIAIANSLAAMLVVGYAPNKRMASFIKRLGTDGVTVLLRNNDANVTTDLIDEAFGVRFTNIRIMSNNSSRVYNRYRTRVRERTKTGIIHDGSAFSFVRSFTMSYSLCGTFKVENLIQLINVILGVLLAVVLSLTKVIAAAGVWPLLVFQLFMMFTAFLAARLRGIF
ncbi:MAG: cation-translocating P-type ATPase [Clostridia bacterium]|nr:cation-translocating P-type ATPase [Clostridia bacterium]